MNKGNNNNNNWMHEIQIKNLWYGIKKTEEKRQMKIKKGVSQRKTLWDQKAKQIDEKSNNKFLRVYNSLSRRNIKTNWKCIF